MTEQHIPHEAMEVDYDSDATEVLDFTEEYIDDDEGEGEEDEENEEGSITPDIFELNSEDELSPQIARRVPAATAAAVAVAPATPAAAHQLSDDEGEETDEEGSRTPGTHDPVQGLHSEAAAAATTAAEEPAAAEEPPQPEEPQHPSSSSQGLHSSHPPPIPPPSVPPDDSQAQQETTQTLFSELQERSSVGPISAGPSNAEDSDSNTTEMLNTLGVAGPSTSVVPLSNTPEKQSADAAPAPSSVESDDEGQTCSICLDPWTNKGDHRLSSLKCGHLFGYECILKWVQESSQKNRKRCPQCNAKVNKKDIRVIYAKNIKVLDTTEKEEIMKELEKEREEKRRLEVQHAQTKLKYELKSQLVVKLQKELEMLKASASGAGLVGEASLKVGESSSLKKRLVFKEWMEVCREGGCRVMAHSEWLAMVVVSMPSQVSMFPGYGVKKIDLLTSRVEHYVPLHQKQIRDLAFSPAKRNLLLSVGMDRIVKITNICTNASVAQYTASAPVWCCSWSTTNMTAFYVGTTFGHLHQYDTRNTSGPVATIELPGSGPAVSMTYVHPGPESTLTWDGLLVARLQSCFFVETGMPGEAKSYQLPLEGTFTSVSNENDTCHVLVSCRPSQRHPHARHIVCHLHQVTTSEEEDEAHRRTVTTQPVYTFQGGTTQKVLTRSVLIPPPFPGYSPLVCASDESTQSIYVWELSSMNCLQQLRHSDMVLDLLKVTVRETPYLMALTEKGVRMYSWNN